jgi:quercetin dioxygenase-like cupin family protein
MVPMISRDARLVVWLGSGARTANMNFVVMEPGEENTPHIHAESEDTIFILEGRGTLKDHTNDVVLDFQAGDVIHIPIGLMHAVRADRGEKIVSVGGPCPADTGMLRAAGVDVDALLERS